MARSRSGARRYAEAAFEIALRDGSVEEWRSDLDTAAAIVGDERLGHALANPAMPLEERAEHLDAILQAPGRELVTRPVRNLIQLLLRRGRIEELPRVAAEFRRLDNHRQGITSAVATSAAPLTDDEVEALRRRLEEMTGGRVELAVQVDPSLLGGLLVRVGDRLIDGSVLGRLERLRSRLLTGAL